MSIKKDDRVRRLAGGHPRYDADLSCRAAKALHAQRGQCRANALAAVLARYGDVYVEGIAVNPHSVHLLPEDARNGVLHAWCIKDAKLVDPTVNAVVMPDTEGHDTCIYTPLAALTRGELLRARGPCCDDAAAVLALIDSLSARYHVPDGVGAWTKDDDAIKQQISRARTTTSRRSQP